MDGGRGGYNGRGRHRGGGGGGGGGGRCSGARGRSPRPMNQWVSRDADKDESQESIREGLPVVSFSLGDTAEFLFGEERDFDKAEKVELESGDVLIFGGKSRLVFHGVSNILANTAPKPLLEETCLKPGRLNLTFREY